jgi:hypothetical protein
VSRFGIANGLRDFVQLLIQVARANAHARQLAAMAV